MSATVTATAGDDTAAAKSATAAMANQLKQIEQAAALAFDNNDYFVQILDTIIAISLAQPLSNSKLQIKCMRFFHRSFAQRHISSFQLRLSNAHKLVDILCKFLLPPQATEAKHYALTQLSIELFAAVYDLLFHHLILHPNERLWKQTQRLKDFLIPHMYTAFPLSPLNRETDLNRSIGCKIALASLIAKIIKTQLPPPPSGDASINASASDADIADKESDDDVDISIAMVSKSHPFLYNSNINTQGQMLIDFLLGVLNNDLLISTTLFSTIITHLMSLFKTRPNFIGNKFLNFILAYESQFKKGSKFDQNVLKLRLIRRFNDRIDRILMAMLLNRGFIDKDVPLKTRFGNKLSYMVEQATKQRKLGILSAENDTIGNPAARDGNGDDEQQRIKRRKLDAKLPIVDFYDESAVAKANTYKSLYTLINPQDELANFDLSSIPQDMLNRIIITGLAQVDMAKLNRGLKIVGGRYLDLYKRHAKKEEEKKLLHAELQQEEIIAKQDEVADAQNHAIVKAEIVSNDEESGEEDADSYDPLATVQVKEEKQKQKQKQKQSHTASDSDEFDFEMGSKKFELPVPRLLDSNEKLDQLKLIVDNFIATSSKAPDVSTDSVKEVMKKEPSLNGSDEAATATVDDDDDGYSLELQKVAIPKWNKSSWIKVLCRLATRGTILNPDISSYIREAIFSYFKQDMKAHIDGVVDWLNEEYYSAFVVEKTPLTEIAKSQYHKYTGEVLDFLIPFLEPSDRNIFIRLLSELPYLDYELIARLKSVCRDPVRFKIGFQPLLYLIMFRPPIFDACIQLLVDMYKEGIERNNEQLKSECLGYLKKYKSDAIPLTENSTANTTNV